MPVAEYKHREPAVDGKPVFLIETLTNREFNGKRAHVVFRMGKGRTTSPRRALWFAERPPSILSGKDVYLVTCPEGFKGFTIAKPRKPFYAEEDEAGFNEEYAASGAVEDPLDEDELDDALEQAEPTRRRRRSE